MHPFKLEKNAVFAFGGIVSGHIWIQNRTHDGLAVELVLQVEVATECT